MTSQHPILRNTLTAVCATAAVATTLTACSSTAHIPQKTHAASSSSSSITNQKSTNKASAKESTNHPEPVAARNADHALKTANNAQAPALSGMHTPDPDDAHRADIKAAYNGTPSVQTNASTQAANKNHAAQKTQQKTTSLPANRLYIPSIGLEASIIPEHTTTTGGITYLNIPQQNWRVAWDARTPAPSASRGNTVISGHVTINGYPGVFLNLHKVKINSVIYTTDAHDKLHAYRVATKQQYKKSSLPWQSYNPDINRSLTLFTCAGTQGIVNGPYGKLYGHHDNLVVQAIPVPIAKK